MKLVVPDVWIVPVLLMLLVPAENALVPDVVQLPVLVMAALLASEKSSRPLIEPLLTRTTGPSLNGADVTASSVVVAMARSEGDPATERIAPLDPLVMVVVPTALIPITGFCRRA